VGSSVNIGACSVFGIINITNSGTHLCCTVTSCLLVSILQTFVELFRIYRSEKDSVESFHRNFPVTPLVEKIVKYILKNHMKFQLLNRTNLISPWLCYFLEFSRFYQANTGVVT
jgi:hypothetical protein